MNILITNDDGVHAPGIKALKAALEPIAKVTVIAPLEERSTTGHTLTLDHPLRMVEIEKDTYGCSGYPADCTLMGLAQVMKENKPDLVISGINRGANLGQDVYYSGTAAGAREAVFHNVPGISVSLVLEFGNSKQKPCYDIAGTWIRKIVEAGFHRDLPPLHMLNVNVPNIENPKGAQLTTLGFRRYSEEVATREDFRGRPYFWVGGVYEGHTNAPGSDCHSVELGYVSISPLNLLGQSSEELDTWAQRVSKL
tara:strand:+ start:4788 stop:5546 length:759 start_codon:yes stop_codon:yes gene_type:complete